MKTHSNTSMTLGDDCGGGFLQGSAATLETLDDMTIDGGRRFLAGGSTGTSDDVDTRQDPKL